MHEKAKFIADTVLFYRNNRQLVSFFDHHDAGVPLAQGLVYGLCVLTNEGKQVIEETWQALCRTSKADPTRDDYRDIHEILDLEPDEYY